MEKKDLLSESYETLREELCAWGEPAYRVDQIYQWLHVKLADHFSEMTNLPGELRDRLDASYEIRKMEPKAHQISAKDGTEKFLFSLCDHQQIESVLMQTDYGYSACISSQVGCKMGCQFCASTLGGFQRNLTVSEMLRQVYVMQKTAGYRITNVVVMGIGEPLDNEENLVRFIRMLSDDRGLHISQRKITVSTCGIVPGIEKLALEQFQITLALSLHSAIQEKREGLMPIAKTYPLPEVLQACDDYCRQTGRRMTYEYSLMDGVNDGPEDVQSLVEFLQGRSCHLNLIPINTVRERTFVKPSSQKALEFKNTLEKNGINVTIRKERGSDIDGACGQLRRRYAAEERES